MAKKHRVSSIGRLLAKVPKNKKILLPFYLAAQLYLEQSSYVSAQLPVEWDGLRIAFISDIHYGPMFTQQRAVDLINRVNTHNVDIVLLGGDYGETTATAIELFKVIPRIKAKIHVLAAIGNHDLNGTREEIEELKNNMLSLGITPLQNACFTMQRERGYLRFCSTDDTRHGQPDISILKKDVSPETFTIFFPHSPDILPSLTSSGQRMFDLALCGHTHGGQIAFFGRSLHSSSKFGDRYRTGWMQENGHDIMVSNGVGTSLIPVRIGAPPQYHIITLKRKED